MNAISPCTAAMNVKEDQHAQRWLTLCCPIGIGEAHTLTQTTGASAAPLHGLLATDGHGTRVHVFEDFVILVHPSSAPPLRPACLRHGADDSRCQPRRCSGVRVTRLVAFRPLDSARCAAAALADSLLPVVANLDDYRQKGNADGRHSARFRAPCRFFALLPWFGPALVPMAAIGFVSMVFMTVNNTAIQMVIPTRSEACG